MNETAMVGTLVESILADNSFYEANPDNLTAFDAAQLLGVNEREMYERLREEIEWEL